MGGLLVLRSKKERNNLQIVHNISTLYTYMTIIINSSGIELTTTNLTINGNKYMSHIHSGGTIEGYTGGVSS